MRYRNDVKKVLLIVSILLMVLFNQPTQAHAWFFNFGARDDRDRHGRYTEVVVGSDRYYYDGGVFYRGSPGNYVVVEAPAGAIITNIPSGYEQVNIDGVVYLRSGNVYYRHRDRGYEVVRIDRSREHGDHHDLGGDRRDDHRDDHHGG
jgi:Family of unknown function (DUF6515)